MDSIAASAAAWEAKSATSKGAAHAFGIDTSHIRYRLLQFLVISEAIERHSHPVGSQRPGGRQPDTAAGAGNQSNLRAHQEAPCLNSSRAMIMR